MRNHFHLVVETPRANLVAGMKWFLGTYTMRFNRRHRLSGHLFAGPYKSLLLDEGDASYLREACDYVHLNPSLARIVPAEAPLESYPWSSYPAYLAGPRTRPQWLRCDRLMGEHGLQEETGRSRREFAQRMEIRRVDVNGPMPAAIKRGWSLGGADFLSRLVDHFEVRQGSPARRYGNVARTDEELAERIVRVGLREFGLNAGELTYLRKGEARKVQIARRVRNGAAVDLSWIAQRLQMGSPGYVANLLRKV